MNLDRLDKETAGALFMVMNREVESLLLIALGKLMPLKPDVMEALAKRYDEALGSEPAATIPKEAYDKGRALIGLLLAAAEFHRAGARYAETVLLQMAKAEPK